MYMASKSVMMDWPARRCSRSRYAMTWRTVSCLVLYIYTYTVGVLYGAVARHMQNCLPLTTQLACTGVALPE